MRARGADGVDTGLGAGQAAGMTPTPPRLDPDALARDSFAIVRRFLAPDEVARLQAGLTRLRARAASCSVDPRRIVVGGAPPALRRVVWCEGLDPAFDGWGTDPRFLAVARQVLGCRGPLVQLLQQLHPKAPSDDVAYTPHQDASNRRYGTDRWRDPGPQGGFAQLVVALDPADASSGGLSVWPGSHRRGFQADPETGVLPPAACRPEDARALSLQPGDLLAFGPFLIHGSPPNPSPRPRTLFIQGYTRPGVNGRVYPGSGTGVWRGETPAGAR